MTPISFCFAMTVILGAEPPQATAPVAPLLDALPWSSVSVEGVLGDRLEGNRRNWLLTAPSANPAMLQMYRDRDRTPFRELLPWSGEFAGKYLTAAVGALALSNDPSLRRHLEGFVAELIATQNPDGYFGPFPKERRMIGKGLWDLWGQYHVMLGLLKWHELTGNPAALQACQKCADHFCAMFLDNGHRVLEAASEEMNQSPLHVFVLLHRKTGDERYLRLAREIEKDWRTPPSGDYVRTALAGTPFFKTPKPRWESLHAIQGIAELFWLTGNADYRRAYEQIWWSIVENDRHNTGGFSSGEQATGNPYDPRPIETCCTIAWMAVTLDYLRLSGNPRAADELELSTWNAILGSQNPEGRWWTYNTPMDGERKASAHEIVFQARAGSPELNCCSVNGPRGLGLLAEWAVQKTDDGIAVNWYGPMSLTCDSPVAGPVELRLDTSYPLDGRVRIHVRPKETKPWSLWLRIPGWSARTKVSVQGEPVNAVFAGSYLTISRMWKPGDAVDLELDLSPWFWVGEREAAGKISVFRGPILLAYDPRFDQYDVNALPELDPKSAVELVSTQGIPQPKPILLVRCSTSSGGTMQLCDFATAGAAGNPYRSWLPAKNVPPAPFGRDNPMRLLRP